MAEMGRQVSVVTLGGRGATLSSASVFAVANGLAQVEIDPSALERLSNQQQPSPSGKFSFSLLKGLSREEARASLLLAINKFLLSGGGIRRSFTELISDALNNSSAFEALNLDHVFDVTEEELFVLEKSLFILDGLCAILDHQSSALSTIADAVAALSCEASGADIGAFNLIYTGDASSANKDEIGVASDLKVLLNGSKLVGKLESDAVSEIPRVHGTFREIARLAHSRTRVELNSPVVKGIKGGSTSGTTGTDKALATAFTSLAEAFRHLGVSSWSRAKMNIDSMGNVDLSSTLKDLFNRECPMMDCLGDLFMYSSQSGFKGQYIMFFHDLYRLSGVYYMLGLGHCPQA